MNNVTKVVAVLVVLIMMTSVLFGCTKTTDVKDTQPSDSSNKKAAEEGQKQEKEPQKQVTSEDLGGLVLPLTDEPVTFKFLITERPDAAVKNDWPVVKAIAERTNVHIDFQPVPSAGMKEKKQILLATNAIPDITVSSPKEGRIYGPQGVFLDMKEIIEENAPNIKALFAKHPESRVISTAQDGGVYALPALQREGWFSVAWMARKDLLDSYGIEPPSNPEEFYNMLKALKDENPESYPLVTRDLNNKNGLYRVFTRIFTEVDGLLGFNAAKKEFAFAPNHPGFKDMLVFLNRLYKEGLMDPEFALMKTNQWEERLLSGKSFVTYDYKTRPDQFNQKASSADPGTSFNMYPLPMFAADGITVYQVSDPVVNDNAGIALSSKIKNKEVAVKFLDYLYSKEGLMFTTFGILGETYDIVDGKPVIKESLGKDPAMALRRDYGALYDGLWLNANLYHPKRSQTFYDCEDMYKEYILPPAKAVIETEEEIEISKEINVNLDKFMGQEITKFVMGDTPINDENIEEFLKQCDKLGANELVKLRNDQYKRTYGE